MIDNPHNDADRDEFTCNVEELALSRNAEFDAILQRSEQRIRSEGGLSSDDVRMRLGIDCAAGP